MVISKKFALNKQEGLEIKGKVLNWLHQFNTFCFLDNNQYSCPGKTHELLVGAGVVRKFESSEPGALQQLQHFIDEKKSWLFGHLAYELQTPERPEIRRQKDKLQFADVFFFEPEVLITIGTEGLVIAAADPDEVFEAINVTTTRRRSGQKNSAVIRNKITHQQYISTVQKLQQHIQRGDCYEINFCQEFFAEDIEVNPFELYESLSVISPNPFSALYRTGDKWLLCASPERFLQKKGKHIISQPIKGTWPRISKTNNELITEQQELRNNAKEKAENVMIVDLVRNDLSRICKQGTVKVEELFGVYSFPQVHQMISTVGGELEEDMNFEKIIRATFPMGSMTGAPKIRVMQLIDRYEKSKRGIFSGTIGYMEPGGDFDFNVVIRSLIYNQSFRYLSFQAGSGITIYSDTEKEWEECLIKAKAIKEILRRQK